jgi:hypothetical protein
VGGLAVFLDVSVGCGSPSFGVSANAVPDIRNSDNNIAAGFLISSLIGRLAAILPFITAISRLNEPVSQPAYPRVKLGPASYSHVNRM